MPEVTLPGINNMCWWFSFEFDSEFIMIGSVPVPKNICAAARAGKEMSISSDVDVF